VKKVLAVVLVALGILAPTAYAALNAYTGRGTHDPKMRITFKLSSTKVRSFKAAQVGYDCNQQPDFRTSFTLPPLPIRADGTFAFHASQDFGDNTGTVTVHGRILRGGNVTGYIKEKRVFDSGDVCRTGSEPYRAHPA
jgi:hypothetical protein